jgi:peroxiredoxin
MAVNVGDMAPDFTLPSTIGDEVTLSQLLEDKAVVLTFYQFDFTGNEERGWTSQLQRFQRHLDKFRDAGAEVLAVSVDTVYSHKAFADKIDVEYPLLSDFNRDAMHSYNVFWEEVGPYEEVGRRSVFVIGQDGKIKYKWVADDLRALPDVPAVLKTVRALNAAG